MEDITVERTGNSTTNRYTFHKVEPDTLVKTLFDGLENEWSNNALDVILQELVQKGYEEKKLLHMVEDSYGKPAALKVIRILFRH